MRRLWTSPLVVLGLLSVLVFACYASWLSIGFSIDGVSYLSVLNIPETRTAGYWWRLFTRPNGHGGQYRPLGFAGFFYLGRLLLDVAAWKWRLVGLALLIASAYLLWRIARRLVASPFLALAAAVLFVLGSACSYAVIDVSCIAKYLLTNTLLLASMALLQRPGEPIRWPEVLGVFFACLTCLFCHEGSFIFPFLLFVWVAALRRTHLVRLAPLFLPAVLYLFFRFVVWKVPQEGIMQFKVLFGLRSLPFLLNALVLPWRRTVDLLSPDPESVFRAGVCVGAFTLALVSVVVLVVSRRRRDFMAVALWISVITTVLPFAGLRAHLLDALAKGRVWASGLWVLLLALLAAELGRAGRSRIIASLAVLPALFVGVDEAFHGVFVERPNLATMFRGFVAKTHGHALSQVEAAVRGRARGDAFQIRLHSRLPAAWSRSMPFDPVQVVLPGLLALRLPQYRFFMPDSSGVSEGTWVENGYYWSLVWDRESGRLLAVDPCYQTRLLADAPKVADRTIDVIVHWDDLGNG